MGYEKESDGAEEHEHNPPQITASEQIQTVIFLKLDLNNFALS